MSDPVNDLAMNQHETNGDQEIAGVVVHCIAELPRMQEGQGARHGPE